jgi:hypothetical protein
MTNATTTALGPLPACPICGETIDPEDNDLPDPDSGYEILCRECRPSEDHDPTPCCRAASAGHEPDCNRSQT